jgi:uncharacterized protein YqjF (DUF2071 family)
MDVIYPCHDGGMSSLAGYPVTAPPLPRPVTFGQFWADLTFVHWPVRPEAVEHLYPAGTRPDVFEGMTYVGLIPFTMRHTAVGTALPLPYFGSFHETNVRLYSIDAAGRLGVLFCSLETARLAVVPVVRVALGVPYTWAQMRITRSGDRISYRSRRRWPQRGLRSLVTVRIGADIEPTPLEIWLTARWGAHTRKAGRTWWMPNEHATWPFRSAEILECDDDLVAAAGVEPSGDRMRALFSQGVHARFGRPAQVT